MQLELLYTMPTKNTQTVAAHLHTAAHAQATQGGDDPQLLWWVYVTKPLQGEVQTCTGRSSAVMLPRATRPAKKHLAPAAPQLLAPGAGLVLT